MKIRQITYAKEYKLGLANYSNITVHMEYVVDIQEGEQPNHDQIWDEINHNLFSQTDLDPSWVKKDDLKDFTKYVLKIPKIKEVNTNAF